MTARVALPFPHKLSWYNIAYAVALVALAFSLRAGVVLQRAQADDVAFLPPLGTDELTYYIQARGILENTFPNDVFYYHPGIAYGFSIIMRLTDSSLLLSRFGIALWDSLIVGVMVALGWLFTARPLGGYLTGGIWAVYPMALFYSTSYWDSTLSAGYVALLTTLALWQAFKLKLWRSVALGLVAGCIAVTRMNLLPMLGLWAIWLWWLAPSRKAYLVHTSAYLLVIGACIAPFTAWNYQATGGAFIPIATTGNRELYFGNNRHTNGFQIMSNASATLDISQSEGILRDLRLDPVRFVALWAYKFTSFWSENEIGNGYAYEDVFARVPLLGLIPLNHAMLAVVAGIGAWHAWRRRWRGVGFVLALLAWMLFSHTVTFTLSRMRFPAVPILVLLSAGCVVAFVEHHPLWRARGFWGALALGLGLWGITLWGGTFIPKRTYAVLPPDAHVLNVTFGGEITLLGWRAFPDLWQAPYEGWGVARQAYTIELLWRAEQPPQRDYTFALAFVSNGERLAGYDLPIGTIAFPPRPTSTWRVGEIYGEVVGFSLPNPLVVSTAGHPLSGEIVVSTYYGTDDGLIGLPITAPPTLTRLVLQPFAVYSTIGYNIAEGSSQQEYRAPNGDSLALHRVDVPTHVRANEAFELVLTWKAKNNVKRDYVFFLHVVDANGIRVWQYDAPLDDVLPTSTWQTGQATTRRLTLQLPQANHAYAVYAGIVDLEADLRLETNAPDNRPQVATITTAP